MYSMYTRCCVDIEEEEDQDVEEPPVDTSQCAPVESNCFAFDGDRTGCDNTYCQRTICETNGMSNCCQYGWRRRCKNMALDYCNVCGDGGENEGGGDITGDNGDTGNVVLGPSKEQKQIVFDDALNEFYGIIDPFYWLKKYRSASYHGAKQDVCRQIRDLPSSRLLAEAAKFIRTTIVLEWITDLTILGITGEFGMSISFGENGEFGCGEDFAVGFSIGLLGGGRSISFAIAPGGWETVSADWDDALVCFSFGYTPLVHGGAVIFTLAPKALLSGRQVTRAIDTATATAVAAGEQDLGHNGKTLVTLVEGMDFTSFTPAGEEPIGIEDVLINIGFEVTAGFDLLDIIEEIVTLGTADLPDVDIVGCVEKLTLCEGPTPESCEGKDIVEPWADGRICGFGTTCGRCQNRATWWWGKAFTFCGQEPRWRDGTICGLGTTCNICENPATWWPSKFFTACGREPCWGPGTISGAGTTAKMCCNGAHCPWYWFGICKWN